MVTALADRQTNTITIEATLGSVGKSEPLSGVELCVLLHDELVDLDKPVKVLVNGRVMHDGLARRDAGVALRTLADYGDPTMAARAELVFELDE